MRDVRLGDVLQVKHGFAFSGALFSEDPTYPIVVTPANFALGGGFRTARPKTFIGEVPENSILAAEDLIVTMTDLSKGGDTLGLPALVPRGATYLHNQRIGLVQITDKEGVDKNYLSYYLRTAPYRRLIIASATGSTVRHTSPGRIESHVASLPDLAAQRAIAAVLTSLDDKIAANDRVIETQTSLADALYTVASRAHGTASTYAELAQVSGGGTPRTAEPSYWDGPVNWATPTDITALPAPYLHTTNRHITEQGLAACASQLYPTGSILMTSRATIGTFAVTQIPTAVNQGFIVVNAHNPAAQWWLFHNMRSRVPEFLSHANGATFLELPRGRFRSLLLSAPDVKTLEAFAAEVQPLHADNAHRMQENVRLAATRDELLPLLMSGRISVREAEEVAG